MNFYENKSDSPPLLPTFLYLCFYNACSQKESLSAMSECSNTPLRQRRPHYSRNSTIFHAIRPRHWRFSRHRSRHLLAIVASRLVHTHQLCQQRSCRTRNTRTDRSSWWFGRTLPLRYGKPTSHRDRSGKLGKTLTPPTALKFWSTMPASATTIFSSSCPTPTGTPC